MERSMQQESVGLFQQANKDNIKQFLGKYGIYMVLVAMVIAMSFMSPVFLTQSNLLNIVRQVSVIGTISLGVTLVIISKGIDLSSGSTLALAAVMAASVGQAGDWAAKMYPALPEMPVIVPIIVALLVGTLVGAVNGLLIAKTGIPAFIATLGTYVSVRGLALLYSDGRPVSTLTSSYQFIGQGYVFGIPVPVILLSRLAIDRKEQGQGLGAALLRDAITRAVAAAEIIGVRALLVHALHEQARAFYAHFDFEPSPTDPLHLLLLIKDARALLDPPQK